MQRRIAAPRPPSLGSRFERARAERRVSRRGDAYLLAQHRAHGALEWVPGARDAQSRPALHQWREQRVGLERKGDARRVGGEVETPACRGRELEERGWRGATHAQLERVFIV